MDDETRSAIAAQLTVAWAIRKGVNTDPNVGPESEVIDAYERFKGQIGPQRRGMQRIPTGGT